MILCNYDFINFIESKDTRKYFIDNKIDLDLNVIYSIIINSTRSLDMKINTLNKLLKLLPNKSNDLYNQCNKFITKISLFKKYINVTRRHTAYKSMFKDEEGNKYVKEFKNFYSAYEYIKNYDKNIHGIIIVKYEGVDKHMSMQIDINDNREIFMIHCDKCPRHISNDFYESLFPDDLIEDRYYDIPSPFEIGDHVKLIYDPWIEYYKDKTIIISEANNDKYQFHDEYPNASDEIGFLVDIIDKDGGVFQDGTKLNPMFLEFV